MYWAPPTFQSLQIAVKPLWFLGRRPRTLKHLITNDSKLPVSLFRHVCYILRFTGSSGRRLRSPVCPQTQHVPERMQTPHCQLQGHRLQSGNASTAQQVPMPGTWEGSWTPHRCAPRPPATEPDRPPLRRSCHARPRPTAGLLLSISLPVLSRTQQFPPVTTQYFRRL